MARPGGERHPLRVAGAQLELPLVRQLIVAFSRIQNQVEINALAMAIASKNIDAALRLVTEASIRAQLDQSAKLIRRAVTRGGKIAATEINLLSKGKTDAT